jgi:hypothetical protein
MKLKERKKFFRGFFGAELFKDNSRIFSRNLEEKISEIPIHPAEPVSSPTEYAVLDSTSSLMMV